MTDPSNRFDQGSPDAVVVGAGIIGAAIALELARGGRRVLVVDKGPAVGGGSTSASSSIIRFHYSTLAGCVAAWEAMHQWAEWEAHLGFLDGPAARFHRTGMLVLSSADDDFATVTGHFETAGIPYERLDAGAVRDRFPVLDVGSYAPPRLPDDPDFFADPRGEIGGLFQPDAGFIDDPQLAAQNLMDAARHHGASLRLRTAVTDVMRDGDRIAGVVLDSGEVVRSPIVVNAAGPWSPTLTQIAGADIDMRIHTAPMRQTIASCDAPEGFRVGDGGVVLADMDLGAYGRPQPGGSYIIGGVEADCDPLEWVDRPDDDDVNPDPVMFEALTYRAARRVPSISIPHRPRGLASHYDVSDDWTPIYDRSGIDGFYLAVGTSGNQFKNGPIVGQVMAALIDAVESGHDHDTDPVHLTCQHTGLDLDLGQFSRLREPAATGGNVWG